jgi:hypothetical protein
MMRALALLALLPLTAHAAEMAPCKVYANRGSAFALRQLLGLPFIDDAAGKFLFRKAYSYCVLQDEMPTLTFSHEEQPIVDGLPPPSPPVRPGSVPATDPADAPVDAPAAPKAKATKTASADQALCTRHHLRTVYHGLHWNCRK